MVRIEEKKMKSLVVNMLSVCMLCLLIGAEAESARENTKKFVGPWFTVNYPATFKARPGKADWTPEVKESNSAFFLSPDKHVEFYVYSPQWDGEPTDYAPDTQREVVTEKREQTHQEKINSENQDTIRVQWVTVKAKDGSYFRSWVDRENVTRHTRYTFGIKYSDQRSYNKYKKQYEAFKQSLEQFAD